MEEKLLCTLHCPGEFNKDIAEMFSVKAANTVQFAGHCIALSKAGKGRIRNICTNTKKIRIQKQKQKQKRRGTEIFVRIQKQSLSNDFVSVSVSVPERNLRRINLSHPGHQTGGFSVDVISTTAKY